MPREKKGTIVERRGSLFARIRYVDETGKTKSIERKADNRSHAKRICKDLLRDLETGGANLLDADRMTFKELSEYYKTHYAVAAEYSGDKKISGLRSHKSVLGLLKVLTAHFGARRLRSITYGDVKKFRGIRLAASTTRDRARSEQSKQSIVCTRSVASVNRELALLRKLFNVAAAESWIMRNPFAAGESLISAASETKRERILTRLEEMALLAACDAKRYQHLKPLIIAALDTGARQGELFSLQWKDVDFETEILAVSTYKDKNKKYRSIAFTARLKEVLQDLWQKSDKNLETLVFGIRSNVKRSFDAVRTKIGLPELRWHDLRHSAASRLVQMNVPISEIARILGHSDISTTFRYTNADLETARRAATALDNYQLEIESTKTGGETIH